MELLPLPPTLMLLMLLLGPVLLLLMLMPLWFWMNWLRLLLLLLVLVVLLNELAILRGGCWKFKLAIIIHQFPRGLWDGRPATSWRRAGATPPTTITAFRMAIARQIGAVLGWFRG